MNDSVQRAQSVSLGHHHSASSTPLVPLRQLEHWYIQYVLQETRYNYTKTAQLLGISRSTLYEKVKKYQIPVP
jgi:DNA-binding NtrC family response regulator